jgi:hypothetical protein
MRLQVNDQTCLKLAQCPRQKIAECSLSVSAKRLPASTRLVNPFIVVIGCPTSQGSYSRKVRGYAGLPPKLELAQHRPQLPLYVVDTFAAEYQMRRRRRRL